MKKLIFTLAIVLGVATVSAQESKMWVGGTAGLWSSKVKGGDSQLSFKVMPEFGYILNDDIAIGLAIGGAHSHGGSLDFKNEEMSDEGSINTYTVNPFVRYSVVKSSLGALFVDGGLAYNWGQGCGSDNEYKESGIEVGFRPGIALNVSSKFVLIGKFGFLGYDYTDVQKYKGAAKEKTNSFGFDFDLNNIQLGGAFKF